MLDDALGLLCQTQKTYLGVFAMICLSLGILLHVVNYIRNRGKPNTPKKPFLWLAGTLMLIMTPLCIIAYILFPVILNALIGPGMSSSPCEPYSIAPPSLPPYCGEYCHNNSVAKSAENCTCLQY